MTADGPPDALDSRLRALGDRLPQAMEDGLSEASLAAEARDMLNDCDQAGVPCFIKQLGSNAWDGQRQLDLKDSHGGAMEDKSGASSQAPSACCRWARKCKARISAVSPDGITEAIELTTQFAIGVQWHPELLAAPQHLALYKALVEKART